MRTLFTSLILLAFNFSFSQNQDLLGEWYFEKMLSANGETKTMANPNNHISELSVSTNGNLIRVIYCSVLADLNVEYSGNNEFKVKGWISNPSLDCEFSVIDNENIAFFKDFYLGFSNSPNENHKIFNYNISTEGNIKKLTITNFKGEKAMYSNANLSLEKIENTAEVELYPVPAENILHYQVPKEYQWIKVYNYDGKNLLSQKITSSNILDISNLKTGFYIIEFSNDNHSIRRKFYKK